MRTFMLTAASLATLAVPAAAVVYTPQPMPACGGSVVQECVVSVTRNGASVAISRSPSDPYVTFASLSKPGIHPVSWPSASVVVNGAAGGSSIDLDPADTWTVVLNTGALRPVQVFGRMQDIAVVRGGNALTGYTVSVTGRPVRMAFTDSGCGGTGACPPTADHLNAGAFDFDVNDATYFTDPLDRAAVNGFDFAASTDWVSSPPQLDFATNTIRIDVANSHFEPGGTAVFTGGAELKLPDAMLRRLYDVDDPATLTASAFSVATGAPGATTTVTRLADAVLVRISGLTFSRRILRVVGRPVPAGPRRVTARRLTSSRGRIAFLPARARGSKVRKYVATCRSGPHVVTAQSLRSPVTVAGLRAGRAYRCGVRASSRAGVGGAATVRIPA